MTSHWDFVGCFIWDLFEMSWRRTYGTSLLRPFKTLSRRSNKTLWRRTTETSWQCSNETSLVASFMTYLRCRWDVQRDVVTMSLRRFIAGWVHCWFHMVLRWKMWWNHFPYHYIDFDNALCGGADVNGFLEILLNMCFVSNTHLSFRVLYSNIVLVVFCNDVRVLFIKTVHFRFCFWSFY